jgi:serine/threonine-protein kinase
MSGSNPQDLTLQDAASTPPPDATSGYQNLIGSTVDGKYQIEDLIGFGGMGAVFRAKHIFIGNIVALKVILPGIGMDASISERFLREARAAAVIDHPNAIKVTDFGKFGELLYLVMEFVQGVSLKKLISTEKKIAPMRSVTILEQACAAIDAANENGIIHRDIKPDNIMLKSNEQGRLTVKVLDFGIAKMNASVESQLTGAGTILGTAQYMSPEQCRGDEIIDRRADVYSLGIVAYEMIAGRLPFISSTLTGLLVKQISDIPPPLRTIDDTIPASVEAVVAKCLAKNPEARYSTAGEFAEAYKMAWGEVYGFSPSESSVTLTPFAVSQPDLTSYRDSGTLQMMSGPLDTGVRSGSGGTSTGGETKEAETIIARSKPTDESPQAVTVSRPSARTLSGAVEAQEPVTPAPVAPAPAAPAKSGGRGLVWAAAGLVAIALLGGGGFFAFKQFGGGATGTTNGKPVTQKEEKVPAPPGSQKPGQAGMVIIQGGWFQMGSQETDPEKPVHWVYVDTFALDETEVTNAQFSKFVEETRYVTDAEKEHNGMPPSDENWRKYSTSDRADHPVVCVSWNDARAYAEWAGKRLPTEAEWEYAARGGGNTRFPWGDAEDPARKANFAMNKVARGPDDTIPTAKVKSYTPNGYGLFDMSGNVSEWCGDWYDPQFYAASPERNPAGPANPTTGKTRVLRGGSWFNELNQVRVSARLSDLPENSQYDIGFRCAKSKP